jgi:hypothetical protein
MNDPTSPNLARRRLLKGLFGPGRRRGRGGRERRAAAVSSSRYTSDNPLASYPNREWEKAYRNIFKPDSSFVFLCAPNDTHNCLLRAYVKNGVVARYRADLRVRKGRGPLRQPRLIPLGPAYLPEGSGRWSVASTATGASSPL